MSDFNLLPCCCCGVPLVISGGVNPYGRCHTPDCWLAERNVTIPLHDPYQIKQWNTRPAPTPALVTDQNTPTSAMVDRGIRTLVALRKDERTDAAIVRNVYAVMDAEKPILNPIKKIDIESIKLGLSIIKKYMHRQTEKADDGICIIEKALRDYID